jgi:hypothetical protein
MYYQVMPKRWDSVIFPKNDSFLYFGKEGRTCRVKLSSHGGDKYFYFGEIDAKSRKSGAGIEISFNNDRYSISVNLTYWRGGLKKSPGKDISIYSG